MDKPTTANANSIPKHSNVVAQRRKSGQGMVGQAPRGLESGVVKVCRAALGQAQAAQVSRDQGQDAAASAQDSDLVTAVQVVLDQDWDAVNLGSGPVKAAHQEYSPLYCAPRSQNQLLTIQYSALGT